MIYLLAFTTIYTLSTWRAWWWIRMAYYHPQGCFYNDPVDSDDYWSTFCPIFNTLFSLATLFVGGWKMKEYNNNDNIFKPKKSLKGIEYNIKQ